MGLSIKKRKRHKINNYKKNAFEANAKACAHGGKEFPTKVYIYEALGLAT